MASKNSHERRSAEDATLDQRQRLSGEIRVRFARFGDEVLSTVLAYALVPKRMQALMMRLGIRAQGSIENQTEAVWSFVADHGNWEFLRRVRAEIRSTDDLPKLDDVGDAILMARAPDESDITAPRVVHAPPPPVIPEAPPEPDPPTPSDAESEASAADDRDPALPPPMPGAVDCPAYQGPERRSGVERRSGKDRRLEVAAVGDNKRFGKDRRQRPHGRRESDVPKT